MQRRAVMSYKRAPVSAGMRVDMCVGMCIDLPALPETGPNGSSACKTMGHRADMEPLSSRYRAAVELI